MFERTTIHHLEIRPWDEPFTSSQMTPVIS
jgi:hypothetical protein